MPELLLSCQDIVKTFGASPLFEGLSFGIFEGDHAGLVGPNGSGKSTLLKILAGIETPTGGTLALRKRLRLGYVPQDPRFTPEASVGSVLRENLAGRGLDDHDADARVAITIGRAGLPDEGHPAAKLSGGWKKRLAIARELVAEPELLLLDEPTNHLDVDGILWLEELLQREPAAFLAVSHDRYFLEAAAARVLELNRVFPRGLLDVKGQYSRYLETKDALLGGQAAYQDSLRNRVRGELAWLSRKAKARTRKAKARIDEAGRLQRELADLDARSRTAAVGIAFSSTERRTRRLLTGKGLSKSFESAGLARTVLRGLDLALARGQRLGLLGANGSGKTTLLRILGGLEQPDAGAVERAEDLQVVTFDQHRAKLDPTVSLKRTLAPSGDAVIHQGRSIHVAGWARRFLFAPEQLETPVGRLSGGEQARVLIAKLMLEPADLLLLDEPTNDLDIPTLEVLEENLLEFTGAIVLVTHDRYLLDRVSTSILALDGAGGATFYADYAQWEAEREETKGARASESPAPAPSAAGTRDAANAANAAAGTRGAAEAGASSEPASTAKPKRLGYIEQREWDEMESRIEQAEQRFAECLREAADPVVASDHVALSARLASLEAARQEVERLYARWAELDAKRVGR